MPPAARKQNKVLTAVAANGRDKATRQITQPSQPGKGNIRENRAYNMHAQPDNCTKAYKHTLNGIRGTRRPGRQKATTLNYARGHGKQPKYSQGNRAEQKAYKRQTQPGNNNDKTYSK